MNDNTANIEQIQKLAKGVKMAAFLALVGSMTARLTQWTRNGALT
jgi:hypothetical protein